MSSVAACGDSLLIWELMSARAQVVCTELHVKNAPVEHAIFQRLLLKSAARTPKLKPET